MPRGLPCVNAPGRVSWTGYELHVGDEAGEDPRALISSLPSSRRRDALNAMDKALERPAAYPRPGSSCRQRRHIPATCLRNCLFATRPARSVMTMSQAWRAPPRPRWRDDLGASGLFARPAKELFASSALIKRSGLFL